MIILAYLIMTVLIILSIFTKTRVVKCLSLVMAITVGLITIFGIRTNINIYNIDEDSISFKIRHIEIYNGHNFKRFVSHMSFDKLKDKIQQQYKDAFVYDGVIYVVKNNTIYSVSEEKEVRRLGIKCHEYIANVNYLIIKEGDKSYYVDFPRGILTNTDNRQTLATFDEIAKFYNNFTNITISNDKIVLNKNDKQISISLVKNVVVVEIG